MNIQPTKMLSQPGGFFFLFEKRNENEKEIEMNYIWDRNWLRSTFITYWTSLKLYPPTKFVTDFSLLKVLMWQFIIYFCEAVFLR